METECHLDQRVLMENISLSHFKKVLLHFNYKLSLLGSSSL